MNDMPFQPATWTASELTDDAKGLSSGNRIGRKESGRRLERNERILECACFGGWSAYSDQVIDIAAIKARFEALAPVLDERGRRLFAASEARAAGRGGVVAVSRATGIARSTIGRGLADLRSGMVTRIRRVRRPGGGGKGLSLDNRVRNPAAWVQTYSSNRRGRWRVGC